MRKKLNMFQQRLRSSPKLVELPRNYIFHKGNTFTLHKRVTRVKTSGKGDLFKPICMRENVVCYVCLSL